MPAAKGDHILMSTHPRELQRAASVAGACGDITASSFGYMNTTAGNGVTVLTAVTANNEKTTRKIS